MIRVSKSPNAAKHRFCAAHVLLAMILCLPGATASAQMRSADEDQVKAAFLLNFGKFVEWPATAFTDHTDLFRICISGAADVANALGVLAIGQKLNGRAVSVMPIDHHQPLKQCHMLFIGNVPGKERKSLLAEAKGTYAFTVAEEKDFTDEGSMLGLVNTDNRLSFEINQQLAEEAGLKVSSKLLSLAKIVRGRR
ncbi:MAG: putative transrane protein [Candidatus Angelobacter sp.]|jgi:hypothetical protein|nr:putative transrane protein [Candidatus Angelobacter sp.]